MSGIAGWAGYGSGKEENESIIRRMGASLTRFDNTELQFAAGENGALCVAACVSGLADCCIVDGMLSAIQGIYKWSDPELLLKAEQNGAARALLAGYQTHGADILKKITGRFSAAVICDNSYEVLLATDRLSSEQITYGCSDSAMIFASTPDALRGHPAAQTEIDPQAIFNYVYFHVIPGPGSIYRGYQKLLPGTFVRYKNGGFDRSIYSKIDYRDSGEGAGFADLKGEFLSLLRKNVQGLADTGKTGAFLSGGTDSSTVAGILGETLGCKVPTYSIGFAAQGYDEMEYARIAARHFDTDHHEYYVTPEDIVDVVPEIAEIYGEPFGNSSAVPAYYCARLAKRDGISRMLAGDGGDELFAGNPHYARQNLFSLYDAVPGVFRKRLIEPFVNSSFYPDFAMPLRKIRSYVEQASVPMPARLETYNLLTRLGIENVFQEGYLQQVDCSEPDMLMSSHYQNTNAGTNLNRMLWFDYKFILADNDLPKVSKMCELAGLGVAYPLLSDEMVEFAARIPVRLKLKRNKLRFFFKESLRGFLPDEILAKQKHGFGLPVGVWMQSHDGFGQLVRDNLNDLAARKIVNEKMVRNLLDSRLAEHAPFYGGMAWVLMMLEQWFKHHST